MADILISGYHGFANSGDEALLWAILNCLRKQKPDIKVTVLSKTPEETARVYGVNSVYRFNFFKICREMKNTKMLLFGGRSLLQDVTSSKSIKYYLAIIALAQICGMKTMLYANGIGPVVKKSNRWLASRILNRTDVITLRDDNSDIELKKMGVSRPEIRITADPVFTVDTDESLSGRYFTKRAGVPENTKLCVVSIREWRKLSENFVADMASLCDRLAQRDGIYPLFVPMQYPEDIEISRAVMEKMKNPSYLINRELSVPEMFSVLSEAELVIGMRLHSLIYATTLQKPAMALVYDPKISAFMKSLSQPDCVDVEHFDLDKAKRILENIVDEREERSENLHKTNSVMRKKAEENAEIAIRLLEN